MSVAISVAEWDRAIQLAHRRSTAVQRSSLPPWVSEKRKTISWKGNLYLRGRTWWMAYYVAGKLYRESSKCYDKAEARQILDQRLRDAKAFLDGRVADTPSLLRNHNPHAFDVAKAAIVALLSNSDMALDINTVRKAIGKGREVTRVSLEELAKSGTLVRDGSGHRGDRYLYCLRRA